MQVFDHACDFLSSQLDELMSLRMFDLPFVQEEMHSWMCAIHAQGQFPPSSQV